ncbi:amicyanin [Rhodovarius crocodyli]|uniref:Amicyanin n=1 Tax=Rhodovarius crocodyli TaxID=1979269 RepID=A0A437MN23_9PROT|nr:cupredoxin family copper-binding protein [Rhodovarius crocodyli]RVT99020.1 amicyanin [Rhodovarius crocodyli]
MDRLPRRRQLLRAGLPAMLVAPLAARAQERAAVTIDEHDYFPRELRVAPGTTVVWTNKDDTPHNVVSTDNPRAFRSRIMDTTEVFEFTFAAAGTYSYFCSLHPHMRGRIIVG